MLAPWIIEHFPEHRVYVELFGGAGSVLMRKPRSYAEVYNDLDGEIVNVFRQLRDPTTARALAQQLELTPWSRDEFIASYEPTAEPLERARRTITRAFMAFGTTARKENRTGFRAVPWRGRDGDHKNTGVDDWRNYPAAIPAFVERLTGVSIENRDAVEVLQQQDHEDVLFYVDPPYPLDTRSSMRRRSDREHAYRHELTDDDHRALAAALHQARGMVVVSGYACDLYDRELFPDWRRLTRDTLADGARKRTEVLWLNDAAVRRRVGLFPARAGA
jgi:DNA adenine methylase